MKNPQRLYEFLEAESSQDIQTQIYYHINTEFIEDIEIDGDSIIFNTKYQSEEFAEDLTFWIGYTLTTKEYDKMYFDGRLEQIQCGGEDLIVQHVEVHTIDGTELIASFEPKVLLQRGFDDIANDIYRGDYIKIWRS